MASFSRRGILRGILATSGNSARGVTSSVVDPRLRSETAMKMRQDAARAQYDQGLPQQLSNSDETSFLRYTAAFSKGLPHDQNGEVQAPAYETLLRAIASGQHADFERITRGSGRRLVSPQAAFAYQTEGGDSHRFAAPPPPTFDSREAAAEINELYWQALCRDVTFDHYSDSPAIQKAAASLGTGPRNAFRGPTPGDRNGPYLSQFLVKPVPIGSTQFEQRYRTPAPGTAFATTFGEWLQIQNGVPPWREYGWDSEPRYIRNGRDLAEFVHYDFLCQAFQNAALVMLDIRPETILSDRRVVMQRNNPYRESFVQEGFVTFGIAEVIDWLGRVKTAALKAAWYQKWGVHRRLRPEEFGGRIHQTKTKTVAYPIHSDILDSEVLEEVHRQHGSYLLPQCYPEGAPLHPSYPSGHATVAGACSVILKALLDEDALVPDCVHPSADGLTLLPCPTSFAPTLGAEVNKLAFNVAMGRNWAGIHYRSDALAGIRLGEEVAISILQDLVRCCTEDFEGFAFHRYDGTPVEVNRNGEQT